ncbi:DNA internalization-related competence protein ComEC/Rec2 [Thermoactinomyces mirandus]|uniref:DNA internalization-related competence protein ComEC/Rec2 n=1 Tax=Thermoactinomyces mirandus TaxID=2756294 RepID=A0A7W2APC3_9BACL|nr:DNA internalization-related competence protein ComEC/Rec2 [Thermoactinomyces mirandus]MBA4600784.1 DNA internalization-related competence protein ComEC/Rec2 [Thermoactinomyces mirandus]
MQRPFVAAGFGWGSGIVLAFWMDSAPAFYLGLAICIVVVGGLYEYLFREGRAILVFTAALFLAAAHFSWVDQKNVSRISLALAGKELTALGKIKSSPRVDGDALSFAMKLDSLCHGRTDLYPKGEKIQVFIRLGTKEELKAAKQLRSQSVIRLSLRLEKPAKPRNPGGMDYQAYLFRHQIHWIGKGRFENVTAVTETRMHPLVWIEKWRMRLSGKLDALYDESVAGFLKGLLLGERTEVEPAWERQFSTLGIVHLLSISGLHVTVLAGAVYFIFKLIGLTREKAALFVLLFLPVYAVLAGLDAPVVRATIMAGLAMISLFFQKPKDSFSFLGVAFLLQSAWNPYQIFEAGFQLSFMLTAGLITLTEPIARRLPVSRPTFCYLAASNFIAQWLSFPVVIYHFHEYSVLSWLVNFLLVPLFSFVILPSAFVSLVWGLVFEAGAQLLAGLLQGMILSVQILAEWMTRWQGFHLAWRSPPGWWIILYYVTTALGLWGWLQPHGRKTVRAGSVLLLSILIAVLITGKDPYTVRLAFLDVGQGDATVIETENGFTALIDGGGNAVFARESWRKRKDPFEAGADIIVPYLKSRGIRQIDLLIMTHGDTDHINGLLDVIERFPVRSVVCNFHLPRNEIEHKIMMELGKREIPVNVPRTGKTWQIDKGVLLTFMHPEPDVGAKDRKETNDDSVVILLSVHGFQVLLPGDIGVETEKRLLRRWNWPKIDLLKVAHHGSETSTHEQWLSELGPRYAVISAGKNNMYGHPAPEIISRLKKRGISIWRTDVHGAVIFEVGKRSVKISSHN